MPSICHTAGLYSQPEEHVQFLHMIDNALGKKVREYIRTDVCFGSSEGGFCSVSVIFHFCFDDGTKLTKLLVLLAQILKSEFSPLNVQWLLMTLLLLCLSVTLSLFV